MIFVADNSPLNYLVLISAADVLAPLYTSVLIPQTVAAELTATRTPATVRAWMARPPAWLTMLPDPPPDTTLSTLDPGERSAITLVGQIGANRLLIDDAAGRAEAERRSLLVTGTVGVLAAAHRAGLLDFEIAIGKLAQTTFYVSPQLLATARRLLSLP